MDISGDIKPVAKANYVSSARAIVKEVHVQSSARLEITAQLVAARPGARVARYIESHKGTQLARAFNLIKQHLHSLTCIHVKAKLGRDYSLACGRSILVGVTGFKLTISMCSLIR